MKTIQPLWQPSSDILKNSKMAELSRFIESKTGQSFSDYNALHLYSTAELNTFWLLLWEFLEIKGEKGSVARPNKHNQFLPYDWFPEATLNYAQNLLGTPSNAVAIEAHTEKGLIGSITRQELHDAVTKLAQYFLSLGIVPEDRIAGYLPNCIEAYIAMLATTAIGAVWTSCSPDFGIDSVVDRFSQVTPRLLITVNGYQYKNRTFSLSEKIQAITQKLPSVSQVILIDHLQTDTSSISEVPPCENQSSQAIPVMQWAECLNKGSNFSENFTFKPFNFSHPLFILYSSGTTGKPKCIVHSAGGTLLQHLKELVLHTNLGQRDRLLYYTSCGWMMWNWAASALATGATLIAFEGAPLHPEPTTLLDLVSENQITVFGTSARYLHALRQAGVTQQQQRLTHIKTILSTGSPLAPEDFDYVYQELTPTAQLCSISGGTDIISCFVLGNPLLPVYSGEIQCAGLGMAVEIWDEQGQPVEEKKGELVCTQPFPSMPLKFWQDQNDARYQAAYFERFPGVWAHGDYAQSTAHGGYVIHGRSDTVLNPQGVRIGTAEIYNPVNRLQGISDSLVTALETEDGDCQIALFVVPATSTPENNKNSETPSRKPEQLATLHKEIIEGIRAYASPRHVPAYITFVKDLPKTHSGKLMEMLVKELINKREPKNLSAVANPQSLEAFRQWKPSNAFKSKLP